VGVVVAMGIVIDMSAMARVAQRMAPVLRHLWAVVLRGGTLLIVTVASVIHHNHE
jgi:hypothetical protein